MEILSFAVSGSSVPLLFSGTSDFSSVSEVFSSVFSVFSFCSVSGFSLSEFSSVFSSEDASFFSLVSPMGRITGAITGAVSLLISSVFSAETEGISSEISS